MKNTAYKIGSVAALGLAALGLAFLVINNCILSVHPIGIIFQIGAAGLMVWARITFGLRSFHAAANTTSGKLVTNGPYRWLRHPIYAAVIYFVWAGVISLPFVTAFAAAALISVCLMARMALEERFLLLTYGDYRAYAEKTKRLIPFVF